MDLQDTIDAIELLEEAVAPSIGVHLRAEDSVLPSVELVTRDGNRALLYLHRWPGSPTDPKKANALWVLDRATDSQRERLRRDHANYIDMGGAVRLDLPNLLIDRTDLKPRKRNQKTAGLIDPFADRSSRLLRVLLANPADRRWRVRELAKEADVDPATASRATRQLARQGQVQIERSGRAVAIQLINPKRLFRRWTERYDWTLSTPLSVRAPVGSVHAFVDRLPALLRDFRWALTLQAGAALTAPHASWERVHVYLDVADLQQLRGIARSKGWSAEDDGKLVLLIPHYRQSVWYGMRQINHVNVVSDLQLALDLWHYPVRGREQAEHVIELGLTNLWEDV